MLVNKWIYIAFFSAIFALFRPSDEHGNIQA